MQLMRALVESNEQNGQGTENVLDIDLVTQKYNQWIAKDPFEYDTACNLSLKSATKGFEAKKKAQDMNKSTITNAALARIMPLAAWTSTLETSEEVKLAVASDTELSHANPVV